MVAAIPFKLMVSVVGQPPHTITITIFIMWSTMIKLLFLSKLQTIQKHIVIKYVVA